MENKKTKHKIIPADPEAKRRWWAGYKQRTRQFSITCSREEYNVLTSEASASGYKPAHYLLALYRSHRARPQGEHLPAREEHKRLEQKFDDLLVQIRGMATNLNQLARHCNIAKNTNPMDLLAAKKRVLELEEVLSEFLLSLPTQNQSK